MSSLPKVFLVPEQLIAVRIKDKWVIGISNGDASVTFGDTTVTVQPGEIVLSCGLPRFMSPEAGLLVGKAFDTQREVFDALKELIKPDKGIKIIYNE